MRLIDADAIQIPKTGMEVFETCRLCETAFPKVVREIIDNAPTIEPKRGEWEEKETFRNGDDEPIIEEWQSARCSVCGKYHTTPYMYYFDNYNFCPNCGADMKGADDEKGY